MSDYDDYKANKDAFEKFQRTESERERKRMIRYQESLGPVKTWREQELVELDRWEGYYRNTTKNTY